MKKREPRTNTSIPARMRLDDQWTDVRIMNLSLHGMMLRIANPPSRGSYIEVRKSSAVIVGRVVWAKDGRCGVRAQDVIDMSALTNAAAAAPPAWKAGDPDRRVQQRRSMEESEARSRLTGRRLQFAAMIAAVLLGTFAIFTLISETFTSVMARVSTAL